MQTKSTRTGETALTAKSGRIGGQTFVLTSAGAAEAGFDLDQPREFDAARKALHRYFRAAGKEAPEGEIPAVTEPGFIDWVKADREAASEKEARKAFRKARSRGRAIQRAQNRAERVAKAVRSGQAFGTARPVFAKLCVLVDDQDKVTHLSDGAGLWALSDAPEAMLSRYAALQAKVEELKPRNLKGLELLNHAADATHDSDGLPARVIQMENQVVLQQLTGVCGRPEVAAKARGRRLKFAGVLPAHRTGAEHFGTQPALVFRVASGEYVCLDARLVGALKGAQFYGKGSRCPVTVLRRGCSPVVLQPTVPDRDQIEKHLMRVELP